MLSSELKSVLTEICPDDIISHSSLSRPYVVTAVTRGNDFTEIRTTDFYIKIIYTSVEPIAEIYFLGAYTTRLRTDGFVFYKTFGIEDLRESRIEKIFENE